MFSVIFYVFIDVNFHLFLLLFVHCRSLRELASNQLTGTIPPQISQLTKLQELYAQSRVVLLDIRYDL